MAYTETFPVEEGHAPHPSTSSPCFTALVVDDYPPIRQLVGTLLKELGCDRVLDAGNGSDALQLMEKQAISVVVSDWSMPETGGMELLRAMRSKENLRDVPFVMLTSESAPERKNQALAAGATSFILKPFSVMALRERLATTLHPLLARSRHQ